LRVDPAHHVLGLRLNFFVAALFCAAGLLWFARIQRGGSAVTRLLSRGGPAALGAALLVYPLVGCGHQASHAELRPQLDGRIDRIGLPDSGRALSRHDRVGGPAQGPLATRSAGAPNR
jgi:hypothetical protein